MTPAAIVPRVLTKAEAAAYCGLVEAGFDEWVRRGKMPKAMTGTRRWDRVAIDLALDRLSGIDRQTPQPRPSALAQWVADRGARRARKAENGVHGVRTDRGIG